MTSSSPGSSDIPVSRRAVVGMAVGAATAGSLGAVLGASPNASAATAIAPGHPAGTGSYISFAPGSGRFPCVRAGRAAPLVVSGDDWPGVVRVVGDLQADIERVTGVRPAVSEGAVPERKEIVIVGTIGRSPLVDGLVAAGKLDVSDIEGKWETSLQAVVDRPLPGVDRALVLAGSDQRGTIFAVYDVSRGIGVSPWYWWDDVPPVHRDEIYVLPGRHTQGTPAVKYRGIFINNENPSTGDWAPKVFGPGKDPGQPQGLNHLYFEKIFELLLRLKGNYLWPATWGRAFALDDPDNHATATRYGVVMGTSHEAPMMRGIEEWNRAPKAYGGTGEWSFVRNRDAVQAYWRDGIKRMKDQDIEGIVTLGMRGNGDTKLPDGPGTDLMNEIIAAERQVIAEELNPDVTSVPQVFTLYTEVQDYWVAGLRPPQDVTVVFCDDNYGYVRKLPDLTAEPRPGGYGVYYHFDFNGGGRCYKWVDTVNLARTWDQLHTLHSYGVRQLWVVNVGDVKSLEAPTTFFMDYAWNPGAWPADRLTEWRRQYADLHFGQAAAPAVAELLRTYQHLQGRCKPEGSNRRYTLGPSGAISVSLSSVPFDMDHYAELDLHAAEWKAAAALADRIAKRLPADRQDAFHELLGYPVKATANLWALRWAEFHNIRYAAQGRAATNDYADAAEARFADDAAMAKYYNETLAGGKWSGWQADTKFDYGDKARYGDSASWAQPPSPDVIFPALQRITVPSGAEMGVAIDGASQWWPQATDTAQLPPFSPHQDRPAQWIEVFNRGTTPFAYEVTTGATWLKPSAPSGTVRKETRITLRVDWSQAPGGTTRIPVTVTGADRTVTVQAVVQNPPLPSGASAFVEAGGYVSMEAEHPTEVVGADGITWLRIPDIGRTGSGMTTLPATAPVQTPGGGGPRLDYRFVLTDPGDLTVWAYLLPRNNTSYGTGLHYAVSVDDQAPQTVDITAGVAFPNTRWEMNAVSACNRTATTWTVTTAGEHVLRYWMVDPTLAVQKFVIDTGGLKDTYLGPPESRRR
ncbi:glycosyl hydrolase 115 family protein [Streptomyces sp. NPDC047043]|uniref:glycosyl hydrolase 115 family protein n=1 Tax=Streptomyces sp. NPDC047043 TaxID=3154497 RepID=UPI0034068DE8